MTVAFFTHSDSLTHATPLGHPECVARAEAIERAIEHAIASAALANIICKTDAPLGTDEQILLAHSAEHLDTIKTAARTAESQNTLVGIDGDTIVSAGSMNAARRAVGAICQAVDLIKCDAHDTHGVSDTNKIKKAFLAHRPPGHHAEINRAMGFCLFNTIAIGAKYALATGFERVAIVDFDVHHGNGTQDIAWNDARIAFGSTHQMPLYPGSGAANERGAHDNIINVPMAAGASGADIINALREIILPKLAAHRPEILFVSAGFDAHRNDPLANLNLHSEDFATISEILCDFAQQFCESRLVSALEGGYDLDALAKSSLAHLRVLAENNGENNE